MREHNLYHDLPGSRSDFHSAVLTCFSINLHHFENHVLKFLKQKWITSINLIVDQDMLDHSYDISIGSLKQICREYAVDAIKSKGAFHPKINFFLGDKKALLIFGSGNITAGGHGKNHELFTGFYADAETKDQLPLIKEGWDYLNSFVDEVGDYSKNRIKNVLPATCDCLGYKLKEKHKFHQITKSTSAALLYNDKSSIFSQLAHLIHENIIQITIVSPYYDRDGRALLNFKELFPTAKIDIYLQKDDGLPPIDITNKENISFYNFDKTPRGRLKLTGANGYNRKLHSKIFHFKTEFEEFCLIGSSNATISGLGSINERGINDEFCTLYKSSEINFLDDLGISGDREPIDVKILQRHPEIEKDETGIHKRKEIRLKSVDLDGIILTAYLSQQINIERTSLCVYNRTNEATNNLKFDKGTDVYKFQLSAEQIAKDPSYCFLVDENGEGISNKQPINHITKLEHTDPSGNNRNVRLILSKIAGQDFDEFEIVDYCNDLFSRKEKSSRTGSYSEQENKREENLTELTYEEAVAAYSSVQADHHRIINSNSISRILEMIENLNTQIYLNEVEELMDEEEEADAKASRQRINAKTKEPQEKPTIRFHIEKYESVKKMASNYLFSLDKLLNKEYELSIVDFQHFLLVSHLITKVLYFTEFAFPVNDLSDPSKPFDVNKWRSNADYDYFNSMVPILKSFSKLFIKKKVKNHSELQTELGQKQRQLINKVLAHLILNIQLIKKLMFNANQFKQEVLDEELNLIAFNILKKVGLPNEQVHSYLLKLTERYKKDFLRFQKTESIIQELTNTYSDQENNYFFHPTQGYSLRIESKHAKSLYGKYSINRTALKKLQLSVKLH